MNDSTTDLEIAVAALALQVVALHAAMFALGFQTLAAIATGVLAASLAAVFAWRSARTRFGAPRSIAA